MMVSLECPLHQYLHCLEVERKKQKLETMHKRLKNIPSNPQTQLLLDICGGDFYWQKLTKYNGHCTLPLLLKVS